MNESNPEYLIRIPRDGSDVTPHEIDKLEAERKAAAAEIDRVDAELQTVEAEIAALRRQAETLRQEQNAACTVPAMRAVTEQLGAAAAELTATEQVRRNLRVKLEAAERLQTTIENQLTAAHERRRLVLMKKLIADLDPTAIQTLYRVLALHVKGHGQSVGVLAAWKALFGTALACHAPDPGIVAELYAETMQADFA